MSRNPLRGSVALAGLLCLALFACTPQPTVGSAQVVGRFPQTASTEGVSGVRVTVSAPDMASPRSEMLAVTGSTWGGTLAELPAGTQRTFHAEALDAAGAVLFVGEATGVTLLAAHTTVVSILLQQVSPPPPFENAVPTIASLTVAPGVVAPGGSVSLQASVTDDGPQDALTYAWTATAGSFSSASSASTTWTAPATPGPVSFTFTVTDGKGASAGMDFTVTVASEGSASVEVQLNTWPQVSQMTATPGTVDVGGSTTVVATASDVDGDTLHYAWTASCEGTWTDATSATAHFTPGARPEGSTCPNCQLTATVTDGRGGHTTGTLSFCVGAATPAQSPPRIEQAYRSAETVGAGGTVTFGVQAADPQNSALTFAWSANVGTLSAPASTASTSEVQWTSPSCVPAGTTPTITATVTNALGLSTSVSQTVTGVTCPPDPVCGNGSREAGEACDDGNTVSESECPYGTTTCVTCNATCTQTLSLTGRYCGDGARNDVSEVCDDGNHVDETSCPYGMATCTTCNATCSATLTLTGPFCGDGVASNGEVCDDGNTVNETSCPYGTFTCTTCNATCSASLNLTGPSCGDGKVSNGEACDDGNTVDETSCPYGVAMCTTCNATCSAPLSLTGPFCGDGAVSNGETCDDGNTLACGTCNVTCSTAQLAKATGSITVSGTASDYTDTWTFTLNDGFNPSVVFELDKNGSVSGSRVAVTIAGATTAGQVATAIANAINGAPAPLLITATTSGGTVYLSNDQLGSSGNQAIVKNFTSSKFLTSGMSGGAGYDCGAGVGCKQDADCDPSLVCLPDHTCGTP